MMTVVEWKGKDGKCWSLLLQRHQSRQIKGGWRNQKDKETGFEPEVKYLTSVFLQRKDGRKKKRETTEKEQPLNEPLIPSYIS